MGELESRFGAQLTSRTAEHPLSDEERMSAAVNLWAAAGCRLEIPNEVTAARGESEEARSGIVPLLVAWVCGLSCLILLISDWPPLEPVTRCLQC